MKPSLKSLQLLSLQDAQVQLEKSLNCREELRDLLAYEEKVIMKLRAEVRASASVEFYLKHGEWDWVVRQSYLDRVKSLEHAVYDNKTVGFVFDLWNIQPRNFNPDIPLTSSTIVDDEPLLRSAAVFVPVDKVKDCKISPLQLEAFELLKYAPSRVPRWPRIDRHARQWVNVSSFDNEGYKWHLEGVPPPE